MSVVPWKGPVAAVRVGRVEGAWILNPTFQQLEFSDVDLTVSGSRDSIVMVEGGALELTEGEIVKALEVGQRGIRSEEHTSELQSQSNLVCRLLLEKKKKEVNIIACV